MSTNTTDTTDTCHVTCNNCGTIVHEYECIRISKHWSPIAYICEDCQKAKKISITLVRFTSPGLDPEKIAWEYNQYFPVEALKP